MIPNKRIKSLQARKTKQESSLGKLVVIFFGLILFCCLCSIPINFLSQKPTQIPLQDKNQEEFIEDAKATILAQLTLTEAIQPASTDIPPTPQPIQIEPTSIVSQTLGNIQVSFIDVGQGDAILIRSPEGLLGLIDGGESDRGIVQYLQSQGVQKLDMVIATHPHSDHISGLVSVLKTFPTTHVVTNGEMHTTIVYADFIDAVISSKAEYIEVVRGNSLSLGSLTLDVLNPGKIVEGDGNRNSVVLRMSYGNTTFLFMGDGNNETENELIAAGYSLAANILKVGHHGSNVASSAAFLAAVHPSVAIYSAGKGNDYGQPNSETLARLGDVGANILGTDVNGTITILVDGSGYTIQSAKQGQAQAPPVVPLITTADTHVAPPSDISIDVVSLTSPINKGSIASLTIQTAPSAACSITVYYKSGPSEAAGLGSQTADASGHATWSWKVGTRTTSGVWKIVVKSQLNGKSTSISIPFEVQ